MNQKTSVAALTFKIRHRLAKMLVPSLYREWETGSVAGSDVPRPMIQTAKAFFNGAKGLVGVEIGVFEGANSLSILQELPMKRLYAIDPYEGNYEHCMYVMRERLARFSQVKFIRKRSYDAVQDIRELVDFVYIDGDHEYSCVKNDIDLYSEIVKSNGIVGGHDYGHYGVTNAAGEFAEMNRLKLYTNAQDWWVIKP